MGDLCERRPEVCSEICDTLCIPPTQRQPSFRLKSGLSNNWCKGESNIKRLSSHFSKKDVNFLHVHRCSTFYEWQAHPSPSFNKPGCFFRHVTSLRGSMLVKGMAWLQLIICVAILAAPSCCLCQVWVVLWLGFFFFSREAPRFLVGHLAWAVFHKCFI